MSEVTFDPAAFVELLGKLIGENRNLQNNPPTNVPQEDLASDHVLRVLEPYSVDKGGPLIVRRETFVAGRGNVLIEYPCANRNAPYVSFVGCHLDVVRARELKKERKADTHSERQTRTYRGEIYMYTDSIKL
jgi:acetylornithine deacetylase